MNYRLKLTEQTHLYFKDISNSTHITPNILARFAIGLSLKDETQPVQLVGVKMSSFEINRATLTGNHDELYKMLISQHAQREVTDEDYFPDLFNAHIHRGAKTLYEFFQRSRNTNLFLTELIKLIES